MAVSLGVPSGMDLEANEEKFLPADSASAAKGRLPWCRCCCRRRYDKGLCALGFFAEFVAARGRASAREVPFWPPEATPEPGGGAGGEECYTLLETPRGKKHAPPPLSIGPPTATVSQEAEEEFHDAQSEAASECDSPRRQPDCRAPEPAPAAPRERGVQAKLEELLAIERRCRSGGNGKGHAEDLQVETILSEERSQLWFCHSKECPFVIGCMRCVLDSVPIEDAVQAIQSPEHRPRWDAESFKIFELVRPHDLSDPTREDAIYTVMPAPRPVRDREILQHRWQVALPGGGGGQALIMQSFEDNELRAPDPQRVRAFTHLSGYILRPLPDTGGQVSPSRPSSLEVVVISQCDLGGALPGWFQNLARRLAKRRAVNWAHKLGEHCRSLCREAAAP